MPYWPRAHDGLVQLADGVVDDCARSAAPDTPRRGKHEMLAEILPPEVAAVEAFGGLSFRET